MRLRRWFRCEFWVWILFLIRNTEFMCCTIQICAQHGSHNENIPRKVAPKFNWALSGGSFSRLTFQVRRRTCLVTKVVLVIGVGTLNGFFVFLWNVMDPKILETKCTHHTSVCFKRCTFIPQEAGGSFEEQNREGGHCEVLGSSKPPSQPLSCVKVSQINLNK